MMNFEKNLNEKISNQLKRLYELDVKIDKLQQTRKQLLEDLRRNQIKLEQGPKAPTRTEVVVPEEYKERILGSLEASHSFTSK